MKFVYPAFLPRHLADCPLPSRDYCEARRKGYEPDLPRVDYKADLRRLSEE